MTNLARLALALWLILIVAVSIRVATVPASKQSVVPVYRASGERWSVGESLYAPAPPHDVYRYPPIFAAVHSTLAKLPERSSALLWRWVGASLFLVGLWQFSRATSPGQFPLMACLTVPLVLQCFNNGQANLHIIGLVLIGTAEIVRRQYTASAIAFAFAAGIKMYPLAAGLLGSLIAPRAMFGRLGLAVVVLFALPFVLHNPSYVVRQHVELWEWSQRDDRLHTASDERAPRDWTILCRTWLGTIPSTTMVRGVAVIAGLGMAGLIFIARKRRGVPFAAAMTVALGGIWMTLFGPQTESVTYCFIAPGAAWLIARGSRITVLLAVTGYILHVIPVVRDMFPRGWTWNVLGPQAVGTILFLIAATWEIAKVNRSASDQKCNERTETMGTSLIGSLRRDLSNGAGGI